jgi:hypothetical protein
VAESKPTIGTAIDAVVTALMPFDEKDRRTILTSVCLHLQLDASLAQPVNPRHTTAPELSRQQPKETVSAQPAVHSGRQIDIRTLKDQKQPNSARQMACLVAYYLQDEAPASERKPQISTVDLEKYFKQAGYKLPEKLEQVLADAKRGGYFESSGRGEYKLTRVGYNLVTHSMPAKDKS